MLNKKTALALGNFDGVHIGHAQVLKTTKLFEEKYNFSPVALVFERHPNECMHKDVQLLTSYEKRNKLIENMGVSVATIDFNNIRDFSPEKFVDEILIGKMNVGAVCCGYNYHFGKNSEGDSKVLEQICRKKGIEIIICPKVVVDGKAVSSSEIRRMIKCADIQSANKMLSRPFSFEGEVFFGASNGKKLGFPTANQYFASNMVVPKTGVYISSCIIDGCEKIGFTDIGTRPTFDNGEVRAETHLFGIDRELYGEKIEVKLHNYLRQEKKFDTINQLISQLNFDKENVIKYFNSQKSV